MKIQKKNGGGDSGRGEGRVGGQGGCERRNEVSEKNHKKGVGSGGVSGLGGVRVWGVRVGGGGVGEGMGWGGRVDVNEELE